MNQPNFAPVPFRGSTLYLVDYNNQPYTPMRPIVEGMGLNWASQFTKMKQRFASTVVEIATVAEDGRQRQMICMPLRKLAGWLYSVNPDKVNPEIRDTILAYQNECDEVLWKYWTEGAVLKPGIPAPAYDRMLDSLVKEFGKGNIAAAELLKRNYGLTLDLPAQRRKNEKPRVQRGEGFLTTEERHQLEIENERYGPRG